METGLKIQNYLVEKITSGKQWHAFRSFRQSIKQPRLVQEKVLSDILHRGRSSLFGRQYDFASIRNYNDYCQSVPLTDSKKLSPLLQRSFAGERQILTHEKPVFYAMTAGSTSSYKYIPITPSYIKEVRKAILVFYYFLARECPETRSTPIQFLVGSAEGGFAPDGTPAGFMSGFNYKNLPAIIRRKFVIPYWVFTLQSAPDRYYAMARLLVEEPRLSAIGAFSPVNISNIARFAISRIGLLISDIEAGSLTLDSCVKARHITFTPNPVLARALSAFLPVNGDVDAGQYQAITQLLFPGFTYAVCWQGGNMGHATREFKKYFGDKAIFEMPFSASEGVFAIPYRLNQTGGIAAISSHFLEFIPEEEIYAEKPSILPVWEIEQGKYYYLVITTSGGLYRYSMEDLVLVKGFVEKTPELEFIAKLQRQVSIANERMTEHDVVNAVTRAAVLTDQELANFVVMPTRETRYILLIEDRVDDLQGFADELERQFCIASKGYAFEREDCLLESVLVARVAAGELQSYVNGIQFRSDLPTAQFKPVHIGNDFDKYREFTVLQQVGANAVENLSMVIEHG